MLRVTIQEDAAEVRLRLEGRLAGPWVREAEMCWKGAQSALKGRSVLVDLRSVDFVDSVGEQLLASMYQSGAGLLANGAMMNHLVLEITSKSGVLP